MLGLATAGALLPKTTVLFLLLKSWFGGVSGFVGVFWTAFWSVIGGGAGFLHKTLAMGFQQCGRLDRLIKII